MEENSKNREGEAPPVGETDDCLARWAQALAPSNSRELQGTLRPDENTLVRKLFQARERTPRGLDSNPWVHRVPVFTSQNRNPATAGRVAEWPTGPCPAVRNTQHR